jgi:hypothetical protein
MATASQFRTSSRTLKKAVIERWLFTGMALVMIATALVAFLPSLANPVGRREPISLLAAAHGIAFFVWLLLFLVQSRLAATHHLTLHRRLGLASVLFLALMIALGYTTTIAMVRRGVDLSGDLIKADGNAAYEAVFCFIQPGDLWNAGNTGPRLPAETRDSQAFYAVREHRADACAASSLLLVTR